MRLIRDCGPRGWFTGAGAREPLGDQPMSLGEQRLPPSPYLRHLRNDTVAVVGLWSSAHWYT